MSKIESVKQMYEAFMDFMNGKVPDEIMLQDDDSFYITKSRDDEQPDIYDNREIKDIPIEKLMGN
jgi:hypothetical protein